MGIILPNPHTFTTSQSQLLFLFLNEVCGDKNFRLLILDKYNSIKINCYDERVLFLDNSVPFENGFYELDNNFPLFENLFKCYSCFFVFFKDHWSDLKGIRGEALLRDFRNASF